MEDPARKRDESNKRYIESEKGKIAVEKYQKSDRGKKAQRKYLDSEKGKIASLKYRTSEKGQKAIEKTKNLRKALASYQKYLLSNPNATFEEFLSPPCFCLIQETTLCSLQIYNASQKCFHKNSCPAYKETI